MKLVHITVHFEFADIIAQILDRCGVETYIRHGMVEGKDSEGKHMGTQVFPGNLTVFNAHVPEDKLDPLFEDLRTFREEKTAHEHIQALVLPVERQL
ncbi:MAG: PG0541 family transporter-associated protein [Candidatus Hydrogenedentota bacterium]